jgi:hypothetical protein
LTPYGSITQAPFRRPYVLPSLGASGIPLKELGRTAGTHCVDVPSLYKIKRVQSGSFLHQSCPGNDPDGGLAPIGTLEATPISEGAPIQTVPSHIYTEPVGAVNVSPICGFGGKSTTAKGAAANGTDVILRTEYCFATLRSYGTAQTGIAFAAIELYTGMAPVACP